MPQLTLILMLLDGMLAGWALWAGHLLSATELFAPQAAIIGSEGLRLAVFAIVAVFCAYFCEMYRWDRRLGRIDLATRTAVSIMLTFFMLSALYYMLPSILVEREILSKSLLIFGGFQFAAHLGCFLILGLPMLAQRVLILGVGPLAETIEQALLQKRGNYVFAGFVQPSSDVLSVPTDRVVGQIADVLAVVARERATKLVVAITERRGVLPVREMLRCKLGGVDIMDAPCCYEELTGKLLVENIQPSWFLYSNGFRVTSFLRFYKRGFDLLFSLFGLCVSLPLWPVVALLVKLDSPGPVLYRQERVGLNEQNFTIFKFRTMRQNAEQATGAVWAQQNDPRITRMGNFLRKTRLDELPQLLNVLKGDMSFVGPRPERPEFVETLNEKIPYYSKRHFMKPGVTGWAQVCYPYGASENDSLEKLRYDLYYLKNYSLLLDFIIILETVKVVLFGRGGR